MYCFYTVNKKASKQTITICGRVISEITTLQFMSLCRAVETDVYKCLMLCESQPVSGVSLMNTGKRGNREVKTGLVLLILRGLRENPLVEE